LFIFFAVEEQTIKKLEVGVTSVNSAYEEMLQVAFNVQQRGIPKA